MKFCYFDESGMGSEPYLVVVGIVADAIRMHITKEEWAEFLGRLSSVVGRPIPEFHSRDFYAGNTPWRNLDGHTRTQVIETVLDWAEDRKHKALFSAIDKAAYEAYAETDTRVANCKSQWCTAAIHCILQVQKHHQNLSGVKGHSVLIFDREVREENNLTALVQNPLDCFDSYYDWNPKTPRLHVVVDVPFFADSRQILLAQVADLFAYILRTWAEIKDGHLSERYVGEGARLKQWSERIAAMSLPRSTRYLSKGRCDAAQLFWDLAPACVRELS